MIRRITTASDSVYTLDTEKKTWKRQRGEFASTIRSDEGTYIKANDGVSPYGGEGLVLICPPLVEGADYRYITSTRVVSNEVLD